MNLDSDMQGIIDQLKKFNAPPIENLSPGNARNSPTLKNAVEEIASQSALTRTMNVAMPAMPEPVESIEHILIPGKEDEILARVYKPNTDKNLPVIVYFHGGGWVIADLDIYDASPRALTNATNAVVVSAHYRQAPEHKFPAAHDDVLAAYKWVLEHAKELNGDSNKIALVGESAGGNMAAAVSVMAREHQMQMPVYQALVYPIADDNVDTPSYIENANAKPLNRAGMQWFFKQYLNSPTDGKNHLISLLSEKNLKGLPPTTIITAQIDPLRSEGKAYADLLQKAGIPVRYKNYEGVTHEFFGMAAVIDKAKQAQQFVAEGLKPAFATKK